MPRPVLSETTFNSDNIATSILQQANLQISNENLGVTNRSSLMSVSSTTYSADGHNQAYGFNGFMFLSMIFSKSSGASNQDVVFQITDSDYHPTQITYFPTASFQGDTAFRIRLETNGNAIVDDVNNVGGGIFYININGWYRYA